MVKIKDLMTSAAKGAGLPNKVKMASSGGELLLDFLMSGRLLMPVAVMFTNINHYHAFGKKLIHIDGDIIPDSAAPFGCRIEGDINLDSTEYALGYILLCITATFHELKPYIINGKIDDMSLLWKGEIKKISKNKKSIDVTDYINLPPVHFSNY